MIKNAKSGRRVGASSGAGKTCTSIEYKSGICFW